MTPNWDLIVVERMFWRIDPPGGGEPVAAVVLAELGEDEVGDGGVARGSRLGGQAWLGLIMRA